MRSLFSFLLIFSFLSGAALAADAPPMRSWQMSVTQSALSFTATQMGTAFSGQISKFTTDILFDPERLADSRVAVDIDLSSLGTGDSDRDRTLALAEWFDFAQFPTARFVAEDFKKTEAGYEASGTLTIKEKSVPTIMTFTLDITPVPDTGGIKAEMKGVAILKRADFGLGTGEWADFGVIANEVEVQAEIVAYETPAAK